LHWRENKIQKWGLSGIRETVNSWMNKKNGGRVFPPRFVTRADTRAIREGVEGIEKPKVQIHPKKLCSIGGILLKVRDVIKSSKPMDGTS
jgi:hypothetical protein